jgi:glycosyltransferase involved in cell wall biosynthesis
MIIPLVKISVVIPAKNEERDIKDCLNSLSRQSYKDFEVIVVDGGSKDETKEIAKKLGAKVLDERPAKSPANARNIGAKAAKGDILLFVDADNVVPRDHLKKVASAFVDGVDAVCTYTKPHKPNRIAKCFFQERAATYPRDNSAHSMIPNAWRKKMFWKVGGYDPELGYGEDKDLNSRALEKGVKKVFRRDIVIEHKEPSTWTRIYKEARWWGRTLPSYVRSNPKRGMIIFAAVLFRGFALPAAVLFYLFGMKLTALVISALYLVYYLFYAIRSFGENPSGYVVVMPLFKSFRNMFVFIGICEALIKKAFGIKYSKGE